MRQCLTLCRGVQDALLHLQCTVPPHLVDTFMVNGILIAATQSNQPQLLILHQCLDILEERGLSWNATTWRQVFRLQARPTVCALCIIGRFTDYRVKCFAASERP